MHRPRAALILAGGAGTRLWPLSRPLRPKPFIPDFPVPGPSLIEQSIERLQGVIDPQNIFIVTARSHIEALRKALPGWAQSQMIVEPAAKNTAAAIAYGLAWVQTQRNITPDWGVFPADHRVRQPDKFRECLDRAMTLAAEQDTLFTLGIHPTEPSSQYGYIHVAPTTTQGVFEGIAFTEKPERQRAQAWIDRRDHLWNAGVFIGSHSRFIKAMTEHCPQIWETASAAARGEKESLTTFEALPSQPFDRAVMEALDRFGVVTLDAGWNDVGQWARAGQELKRDANDNGCVQGPNGQTFLSDARGCSVWNSDAKISIIGAQNISVVADQGRILIVAKGHEDTVQLASKRFSSEAPSKSEDEQSRD